MFLLNKEYHFLTNLTKVKNGWKAWLPTKKNDDNSNSVILQVPLPSLSFCLATLLF